MKYEVINISTSTERYVANGILTHNKSGTGCPSGTTYTAKGVQSSVKLPRIFYQASYSPSLPITVAFVNDTNTSRNKFIIAAGGTVCVGDSSTPMTNAYSFSPSSLSTATNMTYQSANYGWVSNGVISISVKVLTNNNSSGSYYWSAALQATDASARSADNNYGSLLYDYSTVTGTIPVSCLTLDTLIQKYDGNQVYLKDIQIGDRLMSIDPETKQFEESIVTSKSYHTVDQLFLLNDSIIKCSASHKHVIKRNNNWKVITSTELLLGDILMTKDLKEVTIYKIDII